MRSKLVVRMVGSGSGKSWGSRSSTTTTASVGFHWVPACRISCSGSEATVGSLGPSPALSHNSQLSQAEIDTEFYFLQTIINISCTTSQLSTSPLFCSVLMQHFKVSHEQSLLSIVIGMIFLNSKE